MEPEVQDGGVTSLSPPRARWERGLLLALVIGAAVLRVGLITNHGLKNNDFITLRSIQLDWGQMVAERMERNHMPLYFLLEKAWVTIAGLSDAALRVPSVVFGILGVVALWWAGRAMFGPGVGLLAALLGLFHQQWLETSFDVRMYGPVMTVVVLAVGCAHLWLQTGHRRWAWALGALLAAGIAMHLLVMTLPISIVLAHWLSRRRGETFGRRSVPWALIAPIVLAIPLIIWWLAVQYKIGKDDWEFRTPGFLIRNLCRTAFGDYDQVPTGDWEDAMQVVGFSVTGLSLLALLAWRLRKRWRGETLSVPHRQAVVLLLWVVAVPLVGIFAAAQKSGGVSSVRYLCVAAAVMPVLGAAAWWGLPWRWLRWGGIGLLTATIVLQSTLYLVGDGSGIREAMDYLKARTRPGHVAMCVSPTATARQGFGHYEVVIPVVHLDRGEQDRDVIRAAAEFAMGEDAEWLHLFLNEPRRSPVVSTLRHQTPMLEFVEADRFGDSRILTYRRTEEAAVTPSDPPGAPSSGQ